MTSSLPEPRITDNGVAFVVRVDYINRECIISLEALSKLAQRSDGTLDPMKIFHAFEANINGVARRMVTANVPGTPLQLGPNNFR